MAKVEVAGVCPRCGAVPHAPCVMFFGLIHRRDHPERPTWDLDDFGDWLYGDRWRNR